MDQEWDSTMVYHSDTLLGVKTGGRRSTTGLAAWVRCRLFVVDRSAAMRVFVWIVEMEMIMDEDLDAMTVARMVAWKVVLWGLEKVGGWALTTAMWRDTVMELELVAEWGDRTGMKQAFCLADLMELLKDGCAGAQLVDRKAYCVVSWVAVRREKQMEQWRVSLTDQHLVDDLVAQMAKMLGEWMFGGWGAQLVLGLAALKAAGLVDVTVLSTAARLVESRTFPRGNAKVDLWVETLDLLLVAWKDKHMACLLGTVTEKRTGMCSEMMKVGVGRTVERR